MMKQWIRSLRKQINILRGKELAIRPDLALATEFHGTEYGGWAILSGSLGSDSRIISVGVGEDASFDLALIGRYGCHVHAFDPTPKSAAWVAATIVDPRFHFEPLALADTDGTLKLYLPRNEAHVSASCQAADHLKSDFFEAACLRLPTLMARLGFDRVDVLKMDIEGAEYGVISDGVKSGSFSHIGQVLVEFHHYFSGFRAEDTRNAIRQLDDAGFGIAWVSGSGHEVLFVRKPTP